MREKRKINYITPELLAGIMLGAVGVIIYATGGPVLLGMVFLVASAAWFMAIVVTRWRMDALAQHVIEQSRDDMPSRTNTMLSPIVLATKNGMICWHNPAFMAAVGRPCIGRNLFDIVPGLGQPNKDRSIEIGGISFFRERKIVHVKNKVYVLYRLLDEQYSRPVEKLAVATSSTVMHIVVDNYNELLSATPKATHSDTDAQIEHIIEKSAETAHGFYQQYDRDKYLVVFEREHLAQFEMSKFDLLQQVRQILPAGGQVFPTFSIGVGAGVSPEQSAAFAQQALELALGRGGDQAVLKGEHGFMYFGGMRQGVQSGSRVKIRMFAGALKNLMEQTDTVFIMGHTIPDLDSMGSAMGLLSCARAVSTPAHILLDTVNDSIRELVADIRSDPEYADVLVTPEAAEEMATGQSLLIIVDTQNPGILLAPRLYAQIRTVVVIDHHLRGSAYIENSTLSLYETFASSASEMVTEIVQYFSEDVTLRPLESGALLAGIIIDTKGFSYNTGVRTFEAASYLRRLGADMPSVRHLFQDDLQTYFTRNKIIESARMVEGNIAIASCPEGTPGSQLLTAQAADTLAGLRGILASFVLCRQGNEIYISGRSLGKVNVQRILEKLGGGGHANSAGVQLKGETIKSAEEKLENAISAYEKEK